RQDADDPVDQPSRDEAGAGEPLEAAAARQLLSSNLNIPDCRFARRVHAHGRPPLAWAPLWERAPADRGYGPAAGRLRLRVRERGGGRGPRCGRRSVRRAPTVRIARTGFEVGEAGAVESRPMRTTRARIG